MAGRFARGDIATVNGSGGFDGIDDLLIARAATKIAFNGTSNFFSCRVVVFVEQGLRCHQEPWGAESALRASVRGETRLYGCEMSAVGKALNRDDVSALNLTCEGEAREFWHPVDHHRAASTGAQVASTLDAEGADLIAEHIEEDGIARCEDLMRPTVDGRRPPFALRRRNH